MNELILLCMEMVGTVAFALSGAMTALRRQMDLLGVMILGLITAVGGGVLRDLLLGITPPKIFDDPLTVCVALVSSAAAFLPPLRGLLLRSTLLFERLLLWADSLGLAAFTVVGEQIAYSHLPEGSWFAVALLGTITGVGGGVVRDSLAGNVPYIFRKHIYALAALAGGMPPVLGRHGCAADGQHGGGGHPIAGGSLPLEPAEGQGPGGIRGLLQKRFDTEKKKLPLP